VFCIDQSGRCRTRWDHALDTTNEATSTAPQARPAVVEGGSTRPVLAREKVDTSTIFDDFFEKTSQEIIGHMPNGKSENMLVHPILTRALSLSEDV